ncbi:symporter small accessory protein [Pontibacillus litoralis]|uniref:Uncharacterized protein n=1 Tax=Pontibacillus litoralis JSM 072002 TaxID=1385512 RepID=A0A0A5FXN6_9BACI|nr:hypothetical protein N784_13245 [Pontibacillus litoralis JSM 072002]
MFGIEDFWMAFIWLGTILAPVGCVVYGAMMWNKGGEEQ